MNADNSIQTERTSTHRVRTHQVDLVLHVTQFLCVLLCSVPTPTLRLTLRHIRMYDRAYMKYQRGTRKASLCLRGHAIQHGGIVTVAMCIT